MCGICLHAKNGRLCQNMQKCTILCTIDSATTHSHQDITFSTLPWQRPWHRGLLVYIVPPWLILTEVSQSSLGAKRHILCLMFFTTHITEEDVALILYCPIRFTPCSQHKVLIMKRLRKLVYCQECREMIMPLAWNGEYTMCWIVTEINSLLWKKIDTKYTISYIARIVTPAR